MMCFDVCSTGCHWPTAQQSEAQPGGSWESFALVDVVQIVPAFVCRARRVHTTTSRDGVTLFRSLCFGAMT